MDNFLLSAKKRLLVPIVVVVGVMIWLLLCHENYKSYWLGTIYKVQTTDFNILHHTLPLTLSELILSDREDLIQKTLDSNYGLFGLVVTDPKDDSVLYKTSKVWQRESWQGHIAPDELARIKKSEPYDLLTDPPPLEPSWEHPSPRAAEAVAYVKDVFQKKGRVIGHLYYVRPEPPPFLEDLRGFLLNGFFEMSGSKRGYLYITLTSMAFSVIVILLIWMRKRSLEMSRGELEYLQRELDIRKKALENLAAELTTQKARKAWLEKEADSSYQRALVLKQSLGRLKEALSLASAQQSGASISNNGLSFADADGLFSVRSQSNPPSALLEEIEELIPALTNNAVTLKSQAGLLNDYCSVLEQRQAEMKSIVDQAYFRTSKMAQSVGAGELIDMTP
ncbi:MAG TPA: hypothetical protein V6C86_21545 [Oculatellaceae cyanobacterium]